MEMTGRYADIRSIIDRLSFKCLGELRGNVYANYHLTTGIILDLGP